METVKKKLVNKRVIILIILVGVGFYGNYNRVLKVDENMIKVITSWIPRIEEIINSDMDFSNEKYANFEMELDGAVYANDLSKSELRLMGYMKEYAYSVYRIKLYQNRNDEDEVMKANNDYEKYKIELKNKLQDYREKYSYVEILWEKGYFEN